MTKTIDTLFKNSGLPGPRGNLSLLYSFSKSATEAEVTECLSFNNDSLNNSPEEFVMMCGIVGFCVLHRSGIKSVLNFIKKFASHKSWRVREAVAIGIQEIADHKNLNEIIGHLEEWAEGNDLEKRAVIAALCEPKLLKEKSIIVKLLKILAHITLGFENIEAKPSDNQNTLRKTLGYGWSVAIAALPAEGRHAFEQMAQNQSKHIQWIVKENLKKNRLKRLASSPRLPSPSLEKRDEAVRS